jgi:hypothetical protein
MKPTSPLAAWLLRIGFVLAALVIVASTLQWPLLVCYGLTALMFAAAFGARHAETRDRPKR